MQKAGLMGTAALLEVGPPGLRRVVTDPEHRYRSISFHFIFISPDFKSLSIAFPYRSMRLLY
jgi:hypothetical protein